MNRTLGNYPLSISTSVAIERLLNPFALDYSEKTDDVELVLFSLETIYRNLVQSITTSEYKTNDLSSALIREVEFITNEFARNNKIKVVFYLADTSDVAFKYKDCGILREKTNAALDYEHVRDAVYDDALNEIECLCGSYYDLSFGVNEYTETIIMTHLPCELLRFHELSNIRLIESRTGALKRRNAWYTKLNNGNKLIPMPFNQLTLLAFGDGYLFRANRKLSTLLKKCAVDLQWRSDTSYADVKSSILKHPLIIDEAALVINTIIME